jgi:hypothetical protein
MKFFKGTVGRFAPKRAATYLDQRGRHIALLNQPHSGRAASARQRAELCDRLQSERVES